MINGLMIGDLLRIAAVMVLLGVVYLLKDRNYTGDTSRFRVQPWDLAAAYKVFVLVQLSFLGIYMTTHILPLSSYTRLLIIIFSTPLMMLVFFFFIIKRPFNVQWDSFGINFEAFVKKAIPLIVLLIAVYYIYAMRREHKIVSHFLGIKMLILTVVILMSLAEELLFRGVIWSAFARKMNVAMAALISSICWSLSHYHSSLLENVGIVLIGLFLSWTYYWTRTILVPMVIHSALNMIWFSKFLK